MSEAEERLARVEATLAVRDVLSRYCHTIDADDADAWLDCFTEDARWISEGSVSFLLDGRSELAAWFADFREKVPIDTQVHLTLNERVSVTGVVAEATSTFMLVRSVGTEPVIMSSGLYHDRVVRCDDGAWRIAERRSRASFRRG
jgi:uncharacterized protein (TIGR02246 family)